MPSRIITSVNSDDLTAAEGGLAFSSPRERMEFYRREIQYETTMLANRTDGYLAAQSFLVIAFGSSMANVNPSWGHLFTLFVPPFLALLGILSTLNALPGLKASYGIIDHWHFKQSQLLRNEPAVGMPYDDWPLFNETESSHRGYRKSLLFSMRTPWIFLVFWILLGVFCLTIQLVPAGK